jgi:hypothetical protein
VKRRARITVTVAVTLWLIGWVPTAVWTRNVPAPSGPQLYAWWIVLGPLALTCGFIVGYGFGLLYVLAFGRSEDEKEIQERDERIAKLERELGIR